MADGFGPEPAVHRTAGSGIWWPTVLGESPPGPERSLVVDGLAYAWPTGSAGVLADPQRIAHVVDPWRGVSG